MPLACAAPCALSFWLRLRERGCMRRRAQVPRVRQVGQDVLHEESLVTSRPRTSMYWPNNMWLLAALELLLVRRWQAGLQPLELGDMVVEIAGGQAFEVQPDQGLPQPPR